MCAALFSGCEQIESIASDPIEVERTPHEAYFAALEGAGLASTTLAAQWQAAAETSLRNPISIDPPFREATLYPGDRPTAVAYTVSIERGQSLNASLHVEPTDSAGVFLDIFRRQPDGSLEFIVSASPGSTQIQFEPRREGTFVLRVQPELLRSVRVTLNVLRGATLAFPVFGGDTRDIGSRFGADRDGGRRSHHGVDIFARRGTPVVAPAPGRVSRVEETNLGGLVVWLRDDERRQSIYYAHLDRQLVQQGDRVQTGDTLGLVGNSGNARTTPPHLHFGIYARGEGPLDPFAFINPPPTVPPGVSRDSTWLGDWVRLQTEALVLGGQASETIGESPEPTRLPRHTVLRVVGVSDRTVQALLPDGQLVALRDAVLEPIDAPIDEVVLTLGQTVLQRPNPGSLTAGEVAEDGSLPVLGRYGTYRLVRPSETLEGWIAGAP